MLLSEARERAIEATRKMEMEEERFAKMDGEYDERRAGMPTSLEDLEAMKAEGERQDEENDDA